ncbi:hypothetical protein GCM10010171_53520 [Actinokineospora fastidiosa]|uniref:Uncharacterized protein n=1 Tax=Actinokineospora fastidiosa TaxID=1816 RepID=A0A918LIC1_9PSEU|nr:hypothetical protein GCM10010171_53520 [Actinokineospora fastidiosa]
MRVHPIGPTNQLAKRATAAAEAMEHQPRLRSRTTSGEKGGHRRRTALTHPPYINDPGVVSVSPVSSHVFNPDRIIGHPP